MIMPADPNACRSCGGTPYPPMSKGPHWYIRCPDCGTTTGPCPTADFAIKSWQGGIIFKPVSE